MATTKKELVRIKTGNWLIFKVNDAKLWGIALDKNYKFYGHGLGLCCRPNKVFLSKQFGYTITEKNREKI